MLTQANITAAIAGTCAAIHADSDDRHLSYLPLAHIFETIVQSLTIAVGGSIALYHGDVKGLIDDAKAAQPTIFVGVPRVYERVYSVINVSS
jgi:long-chain acyl-CoA synthetase